MASLSLVGVLAKRPATNFSSSSYIAIINNKKMKQKRNKLENEEIN